MALFIYQIRVEITFSEPCRNYYSQKQNNNNKKVIETFRFLRGAGVWSAVSTSFNYSIHNCNQLENPRTGASWKPPTENFNSVEFIYIRYIFVFVSGRSKDKERFLSLVLYCRRVWKKREHMAAYCIGSFVWNAI